MKDLFNDYLKNITTYIMFQIKAKVTKLTPELKEKGRSPINLSMGAPLKNPPKYFFEKFSEAMLEDGIHTYSSPKGEKYYLDAIVQRMKSRFGVELDATTEVCSLIGSKEGIANIIRALINPTTDIAEQEVVFIPDPGYASYEQMLAVSGGKSYSIPLTPQNNFMPNLDEVWDSYIEEGGKPEKAKALIINYPNNPLGASATREYFEKTVAFCKKHNMLLISDAAYSDLYFDETEKPFSILEFDGAMDIAVEFFSFSKPYAMTGMRAGWVCGNKDAVGKLAVMKSTIDTGLYKPLQKACADILNSKEGDEYTYEANQELKEKQELFVKGLKELGWNDFNIPTATFYLWLPIPSKYKTAQEFCDDLLETSGIVVVPGHAFGKYGEGFFRVSIVCPKEEIPQCIERMKTDGFYFS